MPDQASATTTKDRLLEAAARVIARDGFRGARLADVAREAGLTTGAVYSNFRDKEELFLAAFDRVQAQGQPVRPEGERSLDSMITGIADTIRRFEDDRDLQILNLELALLGTRDERIRRVLRKNETRSIDDLAQLVGGPEADRRQRAALMLAVTNGLALMRMLGGDAVPLEGLEQALRDLAGLDA